MINPKYKSCVLLRNFSAYVLWIKKIKLYLKGMIAHFFYWNRCNNAPLLPCKFEYALTLINEGQYFKIKCIKYIYEKDLCRNCQ